MAVSQALGARVRRREDPRLITGRALYVDDIGMPGMLHLVLVRSPHAHARILAVDTSVARAASGVVAVWTYADLEGKVGPLPVASRIRDMKVPKRYLLTGDKVRHVGDPVAAVAATSLEAALDAAEQVAVEYEPLPAVLDLEVAMASDASMIHEALGTNVCYRTAMGGGDVEGAFAAADVVVRQRFIQQRLVPVAMEPRGVVAQAKGGEVTIWTSTQIPHQVRSAVAAMLNLPESEVHVIAPEVGGGFGSKLDIYAEEALVPALALHLGRPVKWIESRRENFVATIHGRGQFADVELALGRDGTMLGLRVRVVADLGGYSQYLSPGIPTNTALMCSGCYRIPSIQAEVIGVFTNKTPTDAYRGAGRPEATYLIERIADIAAAELKMDPAELRRRNFIPPEAFPYKTPTGALYDSGQYERAMDRALDLAEYAALRRQQAAARQEGRYLGIGLSTYVEITGLGGAAAAPGGSWESATVRVEPSGTVTVLTGASPHGQGEETTFAQIVADRLGVSPQAVTVLHGDTRAVPYGVGTFGSRSTPVGGAAVYVAADRVRAKAAQIAAHLLEAAPGDIAHDGARYHVRGAPDRAVEFAEIARVAYKGMKLPEGMEPGLEATHLFNQPNRVFPFGTHVAAVELDPDTGRVNVLKYVAVDDCGPVINPLIVEGQVHGGIVQGLAQVLLEGVSYDDSGQLVTATLMDYAVPKADQVPVFTLDRTETRSPHNPLGVKGVGEAGTIGATPAVANAVIDALAPTGVRDLDMPLVPEKIWRAMRRRQKSGQG